MGIRKRRGRERKREKKKRGRERREGRKRGEGGEERGRGKLVSCLFAPGHGTGAHYGRRGDTGQESAVEPPRRIDPGLWAISMKEPVNELGPAE